MLVPWSYTLRSLFVRKSATLLTVLGIAATVAVLAGVLALRQGFDRLFTVGGREDVAVFLRPGATSENQSFFRRELGDRLIKTLPEIAPAGADGGEPLASMETCLAVRRKKLGGRGETNVPIRGVQPPTFQIYDDLEIAEGRRFQPGNDEVIVGRKLVDRIEDCRLGDVILINTTPFKVVGIFDYDGPFSSEIWGDFERMNAALERDGPARIVARLRPEVRDDPTSKVDVFDRMRDRLEKDKETPATVMTDREYLQKQTSLLSGVLLFLSIFLSVVMGIAAVFTATNTMLAAVAGRTHEIGVLLSVGFRPIPIFLSFLFEAILLGLLGGAVGCLFALPLNGVETGTTNWATFTEVAFAFRVTPEVLRAAVIFSLLLGLIGGAVPAWRAARLQPTEALRRR
jgi:ABC-type antimicrobial peptide transport system permease subunit